MASFQPVMMIPALSIALVLLAFPVHSQPQFPTSPCTTSMLTSFTPCMNFITNSSLNATSPTSDCCNVLKTVTSNGTGCLCLIATGMPFSIPVNRSLALSLPRACNMPGVPLQCKASVTSAPAPAPGPEASSPPLPPAASPSPSASDVPGGGDSPVAPEAPETPALTPPTTTTPSGTPTTNDGNRQSVTPSAASSKSFSPLLAVALIGVGAVALKNY